MSLKTVVMSACVASAAFFFTSANASVDLSNFSISDPDSINTSSSTTCDAATAAQVKACITAMRNGQASATHITAVITCSQPYECAFDLSGFPTGASAASISIYGDGGGLSGFTRTAYYNYPIFYIGSSKRISFTGLTFDDTQMQVTSQNGIIDAYKASDLAFANNAFSGAKFSALALNQVSRVMITNNVIDSSQVYGIWLSSTTTTWSSEIYIRGNTISNSWANGTIINAENAKIVGNNYFGNHHLTVFGQSGGQFDIEQYSKNIYVGCNNIHDSSIAGSLITYGVETAPVHVNNIEIVGNTIKNHDGYAVCINHGNSDISNILIHNNSVSSNGTSPFTHTQYDYNGFTPSIYGNCANASCLVNCDTTIDWIFADNFDTGL